MATQQLRASAEDLPDPADRVGEAVRLLARSWQSPPGLQELAEGAGMSPAHFQRVFKRLVGISPKRFSQHLALTHAKGLLARQAGVLNAALDSGLSGPSRLHDLFLSVEAMTPGEYKSRGESLIIRWGMYASPIGPALLATTQRGLCWLGFTDEEAGRMELEADWSGARLEHDPSAVALAGGRIFDPVPRQGPPTPLPVLLRGTNFQLQVWRALMRIPAGQVATYGQVARSLSPTESTAGVRAVAGACGANRISYVIPCHRVIQSTGALCGYRWGLDFKRALLAREASAQI